jgi:hypothetical protein
MFLFLFLFLLDYRRIRIRIRTSYYWLRIQKAQKHADPDPQDYLQWYHFHGLI